MGSFMMKDEKQCFSSGIQSKVSASKYCGVQHDSCSMYFESFFCTLDSPVNDDG